MKPMTRRNVLMLGGAASAAALGASDALGNANGAVLVDYVECDISIDPKLRVWLEDEDKFLDSTATKVNVPYTKVEGDKKYRCRFPWAKHQGLTGLLKGEKFPPHTFKFTLQQNQTTRAYYIMLSIDGASGTGANCCFMCGGQEICIGPGQSFVCDGVEITCPSKN
jgi:hypothetical protein